MKLHCLEVHKDVGGVWIQEPSSQSWEDMIRGKEEECPGKDPNAVYNSMSYRQDTELRWGSKGALGKWNLCFTVIWRTQ